MIHTIERNLTRSLSRLEIWSRKIRHLFYRGTDRYCPVCEKSSRSFVSFGVVKRQEAQCVYCGSLERHRAIWQFFKAKTDLFDHQPNSMLHVAPEACFTHRLRECLGSDYLSIDLSGRKAMIKMDITRLEFQDDTFDVILCSHVLEHVPDDRKAMTELNRVLRGDGWAVLIVPITAEETYEDNSIVRPEDRLREFGQKDHVRRYGPDYKERLEQSGFNVEIFVAHEFIDEEQIEKMRIRPGEPIYFCTK